MSEAEARAPALSVVIAASDSARAVARTLSSLEAQRVSDPAHIEIIVAAARDILSGSLPAPVEGLEHGVRWVNAAPGTSVPRLRALGLAQAAGPLVAFTEDSCVFAPGWVEAWRTAFADPTVAAATGPVEPAMGDAAVDWAVFFCEYAPFLAATAPDRRLTGPATGGWGRAKRAPRCPSSPWMPRHRSNPPVRLAGNNFAVRRSAGPEVLDAPQIHETAVAAAVLRSGGRLVEAAACAGHVRRYGLAESIGDRLRFGREYGALRAAGWPPLTRLVGFVAGPAILGMQIARLILIVLARRRALGRFLDVLPVTLALLSAWSVGEWLGWLARRPRLTLAPPAARRGRETAGRPAAPRLDRTGSRSGHCTAGPSAA